MNRHQSQPVDVRATRTWRWCPVRRMFVRSLNDLCLYATPTGWRVERQEPGHCTYVASGYVNNDSAVSRTACMRAARQHTKVR